ncbi:hypothetical protein NP233_g12665 [Leucocoprinus birnbaumii]|uniref:Uncharacterized protein n=1 Tax=Leucocoprinus birnbaumii TaxID=56174 RepID=A0AAD5VI69_9AGAR|nr:hypothetical protein NP233_g12665 [Leucocoprinus birnbaumii]
MRVSALLTALTTLALSTGALAKHSTAPWKRVHRRHVNHSEGGDAPKYGHDGHHEPQGQYDVQKITGREFELEKRFDNGRFSFYDAGLGACGIVNSGSDFIVALNSAQFDQGGWCFKKITISIGGKSTEATITDRAVHTVD